MLKTITFRCIYIAKSNKFANEMHTQQEQFYLHSYLIQLPYIPYTVETRIKEPTFLGNSLLKDLIFCLYNPYIRDGKSVSLIKTCTNCRFITVAFSPIIYFSCQNIMLNFSLRVLIIQVLLCGFLLYINTTILLIILPIQIPYIATLGNGSFRNNPNF